SPGDWNERGAAFCSTLRVTARRDSRECGDDRRLTPWDDRRDRMVTIQHVADAIDECARCESLNMKPRRRLEPFLLPSSPMIEDAKRVAILAMSTLLPAACSSKGHDESDRQSSAAITTQHFSLAKHIEPGAEIFSCKFFRLPAAESFILRAQHVY